jgi:hypothetical protein
MLDASVLQPVFLLARKASDGMPDAGKDMDDIAYE